MRTTTLRTPTPPTSRRGGALAMAAAALAVMVTACSAPSDPSDCNGVPPLPPAPQALILIVGVHAGVPAPNVPPTAGPLLQSALVAGSPVRVIALDGTPALVPVPRTAQVVTKTCEALATTLASATNAVIGTVRNAAADADGNDLYAALHLAVDAARSSGWDNASIMVIDSGLAERPSSPINFAQAGMTTLDAAGIESAADFAISAQPLDLSGFTIEFQGLGQTVPPQERLSPAERQVVTSLWTEIAQRAGAESVLATPVPRDGAPPETDYSVNLVPVATVSSWQPPTADSPTALTLTEADVHFDTNSDQPRDPAAVRAHLAEVIAWLGDNPSGHVTLYGRTDSNGSFEYNVDLSQRRTQAIENLMLAADERIAPTQIDTVGEAYEFDGFIEDRLPDGSLDPVAAAKNRHVLLVATTR